MAKSEIPTETDAFKDWADRSCGEWPAELQAQAYRAWVGMGMDDRRAYDIFCEAYAAREAK